MFDWEDFVNLSKELLNDANTQYKEALYRTVISRSYYGIFKQVEDRLKELERKGNITLPSQDSDGYRLGSHEKIIFYLQNHTNERVRDFGDLLEDLKGQRHSSDYKAYKIISRKRAEIALKLALKLVYEVRNILNVIS